MAKAKEGMAVLVRTDCLTAQVRQALTGGRLYLRGVVKRVDGPRSMPRVAVEWNDDGELFWFDADQLEAIIPLSA